MVRRTSANIFRERLEALERHSRVRLLRAAALRVYAARVQAVDFVSRVVGGSRLAQRLYKMLMEAENARLVFLTGTPIINTPHETATLLNLMRGPMRVEQWRLWLPGVVPPPPAARPTRRQRHTSGRPEPSRARAPHLPPPDDQRPNQHPTTRAIPRDVTPTVDCALGSCCRSFLEWRRRDRALCHPPHPCLPGR